MNTKSKKRNTNRANVPRLIRYLGIGFPSQYRTKLRYCNYRNAAAAATDVVTLQMSNCKNPDPTYTTSYTPYITCLSGTGAGGAAGTGIYNKWVVLASKVSFTYCNKDNAKYVQMCLLSTNDSTSSGLLPITATGREWSTPVVVCQGAGGGCASKTLARKYQHNRVFGVPADALVKDDSYHGSPAANPTEMLYAYLYLNNLDGTSLSGIISYEIEFDVLFFDKQLEEE